MPMKHAKFEEGCEAQRGAPRVPSENANCAHVVVDRGNTAGLTPSPTRGFIPGSTSKSHNWPLPLFYNLDSLCLRGFHNKTT